MNLLFCSVPFRPSVGGIETVSALLADRFVQAGHEIRLVTQTPGDDDRIDGYPVIRQPSARRLFELVRWADVVFHNNISLRFAWPQALLRRPWVVAHHTWIPRHGMAGRIKRLVIQGAQNIAVSRAIASDLDSPSVVIPNAYADDLFKRLESVARDRALIFVGRLVSDKGVDVLIGALGLLARRGVRPTLTIVGDGPERTSLEQQARDAGVSDQVSFAGRLVGNALVEQLNRHRVLVVPSVWQEPFGVVALEAMACGCVPLVARSGGLPDAVGEAGRVVAQGDRDALARAIEEMLGDRNGLDGYRAAASAHLERHGRDRVARDYLQVITDVRRTPPAPSPARAA
jgi:glycosyltransferase involved in cell wall biosynthesis